MDTTHNSSPQLHTKAKTRKKTARMEKGLIYVGRVLGVHGLKGFLKVHSFTDPGEALFSYTTLYQKDTTLFPCFDPASISRRGTYQNAPFFLARPTCIDGRSSAEAFLRMGIYIKKDALPTPEEGQVYLHDLKGKAVKDHQGNTYGIVKNVKNFGAGDLLEVSLRTAPGTTPNAQTAFIRFHETCIANVEEDVVMLTAQGLGELLLT